MKTAYAAIALAALTFSLPALAQEARDVPGSPAAVFLLSPHLTSLQATSDLAITAATVSSGHLVLDVIEGKASAAVVALSLPQAIAAAREAAWEEGRMLVVPQTLQFHEVARYSTDSRPVGFVTLGSPTTQVQNALGYLRTQRGLYTSR
jgi:hypothetical protein